MAKNIKELTEQRNNLLTQMDELVNDATIKPGETRNLTEDENNKFDKLNSEIATIDEEIRELSDKGKKWRKEKWQINKKWKYVQT